jgi:aspartyl-tRNA(Asn)/glutamyl-tRNA(Gln) amidotransferase subunit A
MIQLAEVSAVYTGERDASRFSPPTWNLLEQGRLIQATEYVNAQRLRSIFRRQFNAVWQQVHMLAVPVTPITAPLMTALAMPCGRSKSGLPIGLQLIGAPFSEPLLLRVAGTLETVLS